MQVAQGWVLKHVERHEDEDLGNKKLKGSRMWGHTPCCSGVWASLWPFFHVCPHVFEKNRNHALVTMWTSVD